MNAVAVLYQLSYEAASLGSRSTWSIFTTYVEQRLIAPKKCGFVAWLVEQFTGIAEITGSNPVEVLSFFRPLLYNYLNCVYNREGCIKTSLLYITAVQNPSQ